MWGFDDENIYSLNANQISSNDFIVNVYYRDPNNSKVKLSPKYKCSECKFIEVIQLGQTQWKWRPTTEFRWNAGDGLFDFIPNLTIDPENGKLILRKPSHLVAFWEKALGKE